MFLSIDAGNSNIVFGFYDQKTGEWAHEIRINTRKSITSFELVKKIRLYFLENDLKPQEISRIGLSSVVPEVIYPIKDFCFKLFGMETYIINGKSFELLNVRTSRPNEIGTDLMANITAAYDRFKEGCIVVDFGTALTFSVVDDDGAVVGVNIVPGLKTAIRSLFTNTSKLPEVKLELPESAIGKDTVHAIQAGVLYGYTGLVKGMLQDIRTEVRQEFKVIATGGLSKILTPLKESFDVVDPHLTLKGIKLITEANQPTREG